MAYPTGQYYINGYDLYTSFGVSVQSGSDDLLKYPGRKESIRHDWEDQNGVEVDTSRVFLKNRNITLQCNMIADNAAQFHQRHDGFLALMRQPGQLRLESAELGKQYYVIYQDCPELTRYTSILKATPERPVLLKFTIILEEPQPDVANDTTYMIGEGAFLII